jgi:D-alanine-D-alanine ligase
MTQHVAVLMGGWSSEREVSLRSGAACAKALEGVGYRVTPVDVARDIATEQLAALKPDVAFNALHGPAGEDGSIQGVLETLRIPYTHSGVLASALAMHKEKAKTVMAAAGVPVPSGRLVSRFEAAKAHVLPPPYVLKPVAEGSSFGVFIVKEGTSHPPQEMLKPDWHARRRDAGGKIRRRARADLRRHGRQAFGCDRNSGGRRRLVRLSREICERRLYPHPSGKS